MHLRKKGWNVSLVHCKNTTSLRPRSSEATGSTRGGAKGVDSDTGIWGHTAKKSPIWPTTAFVVTISGKTATLKTRKTTIILKSSFWEIVASNVFFLKRHVAEPVKNVVVHIGTAKTTYATRAGNWVSVNLAKSLWKKEGPVCFFFDVIHAREIIVYPEKECCGDRWQVGDTIFD